MNYVSFVITVKASRINNFTVDYDIGVKLDNNKYFPNNIMTVRVGEVVPNYDTFFVTTENNDCVVKYKNSVCLHKVSDMFMREVNYIINCLSSSSVLF